MKIVKLTAENVKRLRAVEITPDGNTVVIAGRNGQGKSSILDSIWYALGGAAATKDTSKPIRDGQRTASVTVDLGDLVVTRTWKDDKTKLVVTSAEGASYPSPQSMLDELVGRLSFDPLAFAQQQPKDQLATLLGLVSLPFDPVQLDAQRRGLYDQRTEVGRHLRALEGQHTGMPAPTADLPPSEVSIADLLVERTDAAKLLSEHEAKRREVVVLTDVVAAATHDVTSLEQQLDRAREVLTERQADLALTQTAVEAMVDPDLDAIDQRLATLDTTNRQVRARDERMVVGKQLEDANRDYEQMTAKLADIDSLKTTALANATMPIDGLSFDADVVTYQGVPLKQASSAEQLRVSLAMAMALNPKLRVIRITDGSLLDSTNLALIEEMAAANDFQVWIERVDESGTVGVVIEDGAVREQVNA